MYEITADDVHSDVEDRPQLSAETLLALKEFAAYSGIGIVAGDEDDNETVLNAVTKHFDVSDSEKYEIFHFIWKENSNPEATPSCNSIELNLRGIRRDLGQTLNSTGLTVYVLLLNKAERTL